MDLAQIKSQITTMFMMRPQNNGSELYTLIYGLLLMSAMEMLFRNLPAIGAWIQAQITNKVPLFGPIPSSTVTGAPATSTSSITLVRTFQAQPTSSMKANANNQVDNLCVERCDAVIDYICNLDATRHIRMETRFMLNTSEEIPLTPQIKARVLEGNNGEESTLKITLFSDQLRMSQLRAWIDEVHANYLYEKANKLGAKIFYFNEIAMEPTKQLDAKTKTEVYRLEMSPKQLAFTMNEFRTTKSFANVFGHHVDELRERLDLFVHHPEWYAERGIPHSLGVMLHGVPGAGKTSTIKAIAHDTNRHIFNLSLRPYTTQKQLMNLFLNETVIVHDAAGQQQTYKIPLNRRVYVIEDIDCLTDVVLDRAWQHPAFEVTAEGVPVPKTQPEITGDAVTLSFLLNLLDGVLETPDRILVITTNYPERLDRALIRPGRIDVRIAFGYASREFIRDMINKFYAVSIAVDIVPKVLDEQFTPAEIMEVLCTQFKDYRAALQTLQTKIAEKNQPPLPTLTVEDIHAARVSNDENVREIVFDIQPNANEPSVEKGQLEEQIEKEIAETNAHIAKIAAINEKVDGYREFSSMFMDDEGGCAFDSAFATSFGDGTGDEFGLSVVPAFHDSMPQQRKLGALTSRLDDAFVAPSFTTLTETIDLRAKVAS